MSDLIQLEKRDHIAIITIANPPANTWTADSLAALAKTVEQLNQDRNIFALVVTGQVLLRRCRSENLCRRRPGHGQ